MRAWLPGLYLGAADYLALPHHEFAPPTAALIYGIAIIGAAFVLSWAAETRRVDISAGLALAVLALTTVLPEYAVDFVFSLQAGQIYTEAGECRPGPDGANSCALAFGQHDRRQPGELSCTDAETAARLMRRDHQINDPAKWY